MVILRVQWSIGKDGVSENHVQEMRETTMRLTRKEIIIQLKRMGFYGRELRREVRQYEQWETIRCERCE